MEAACYCRVSTEDQSLDRQLSATSDYAQQQLQADLQGLETFRDKSTGTDTSRAGYREMMARVEDGEFDAVVAKSVSRIARSIRDLDRTADRITGAGAELHIIDEGLLMKPDEDDPYQNALFRLLGVFAQLEAEMAQMRTKEGIAARRENPEYHHGRPPLGFEKEDGQLIEGENYHTVCGTLESVAKGETSKREAARQLDTSRATVMRAIEERGELYGL